MQFVVGILFALAIGSIRIIFAIIKGIYRLCKAHSDANRDYTYANAPREEQEAIDEIRRNLARNKCITTDSKDYLDELFNLYDYTKGIDMEALLINNPRDNIEAKRKTEAEEQLLYVRRRMFEIVKFECNDLSETEKDTIWNNSWPCEDANNATNADKLAHAVNYLKTCKDKITSVNKASINELLEAAKNESQDEQCISKNYEYTR